MRFLVVLSVAASAAAFVTPRSPAQLRLQHTLRCPAGLRAPPLRATEVDVNALGSSARGNDGTGPSALVRTVPFRNFVTVKDDDVVLTAVERMNDASRGSALVFGAGDGDLAGIFTERDFITKVVQQELSSQEVVVRDVMTPTSVLLTARPDWTVGYCMDLMVKSNVRHLPVLEDSGGVVGVLSMSDLVSFMKADDERRGTFPLGLTPDEVEARQKALANEEALAGGLQLGRQDLVRSAFVVGAASIGALLLQGGFLHDHEFAAMTAIFAFGYVGIVFEEIFEFNKGAVGLLMAVALWVIYAGTASANGDSSLLAEATHQLSDKVSEVSEVIFFLLGAMSIVEVVDAHEGFKVVTDRITTNNKRSLLWVLSGISFVMSGILDNLTTTIVMVSLLRKLFPDPEDRKLFGSMVVIAANAGGAWTPIGDVTTTMLWINGQVTALPTMVNLVLPSIVSTVISAAAMAPMVPDVEAETLGVPRKDGSGSPAAATAELAPRGQLVFGTGVAGLLSVPLFKALTGLPPYLGMLSALGVLWALTDAIHAGEEERDSLRVPTALSKIDTSGVLFFLGILLAIGALDSAGVLGNVATFLDSNLPSQQLVATVIGFASAVVDNVPLVAASMGMYDLSTYPPDSELWQLIAFCAGTGGSLLVIGSAAGVALMGLEKVDFIWYLRRISVPALAGYVGGVGTYLALHPSAMRGFLAPLGL